YPCHDRSARVHHGRTRGCAGTVLRGGGVSRALKLGTRGSELALWQAEWVKAALARSGVTAALEIIKTQGDADVDRPLHLLEGKGFFTKEIEQALSDGRIDVPVHSLKDSPTSLPAPLPPAPAPPRADPPAVLLTRAT